VQQQDPSDDEVVRITTNLVQVDPVITDRSGKPVTDLRPDEVQIFEDGKPQSITNFSYVSVKSATPTTTVKPANKSVAPIPPVPLKPEQVRRTIALIVDDIGLSFESTHFVRRGLKKFVEEQMEPDDLVAIIRTGGGIGALQQFTSDKRQLLAAVDKVKWNPTGRGGVSPFAPISEDQPSVDNLGTGRGADDEEAEDFDRFREDFFAVGTLGAINYVIKGLRELPGRKSIVLMSDGIKVFNASDPTGSSRVLEALRSLTDLANRASVVVYTMDARGLPTLGFTAADSSAGLTPQQFEQRLSNRRSQFFESQNGLNYLAHQTGGLFIHNNNDLNAGIRRVIQDQEGYYLIGYRPDESTFESVSGRRKFHKLSLKVTRPGKFNVRMRTGFYGITDEEATTTKQTGEQRLISAITSPFGSAGVHVRLTSLFANDATTGSFLRSMVHLKASDLTFTEEADGWHKAVFDVIAITFGDNGRVVDQMFRTQTIRLRGETYARVLRYGFTYHLTVPVKKTGAYQFRMAVRDVPSNRIGSASQFLEVPDLKKNRLTLSGIVMSGVPLETYSKGAVDLTSQSPSGEDTSRLDPKASPAVRQFKSGLVMVYGLVVYNAQVDKASGRPQVHMQLRLFRDGQMVFTGKEVPLDSTGQPDLKRLTSSGALSLGTELQPGDYALQVIATDALAKEKHRVASQWIDFEIIR
jgi:VWFA-related protein